VDRVTGYELEGLALNGFLKEFELVDCGKEKGIRYSKIIAVTLDGKRLETECMEYSRVVRIYLVLLKYRDWGRRLVREEVSEEMMSGITYDVDFKGR